MTPDAMRDARQSVGTSASAPSVALSLIIASARSKGDFEWEVNLRVRSTPARTRPVASAPRPSQNAAR